MAFVGGPRWFSGPRWFRGAESDVVDEIHARLDALEASRPAPAVAPSAGWTDGLLIVMRHSVRLDEDDAADWPDKQARPYDTPICDFALPAAQADELVAAGLGRFDLIVCSPFRRCLQTAGVVAKQLGGPRRVRVDKQFGEKVHSVRTLQRLVWQDSRPADGQVDYLPETEVLRILRDASGGLVTAVEAHEGSVPAADEPALGGTKRFIERLEHLRATRCKKGEKVLVVAHGDTVDGAVRAFTDETVYIAEECCWVAFRFGEAGEAFKIAANRLESMVM